MRKPSTSTTRCKTLGKLFSVLVILSIAFSSFGSKLVQIVQAHQNAIRFNKSVGCSFIESNVRNTKNHIIGISGVAEVYSCRSTHDYAVATIKIHDRVSWKNLTVEPIWVLAEKISSSQWSLIWPTLDNALEYNELLLSLPESLFPPGDKEIYILPLSQTGSFPNSTFTYNVPWAIGWRAYVYQGPHEEGAFDFDLFGDDWGSNQYASSWITASKDGIVVYVKDVSNMIKEVDKPECYRWANMVVIGHGSYNPSTKLYQEYSWYTHLAPGSVPEYVVPGRSINAGEVIGQEGATGCTSGTVHLHFVISNKFPSATNFFSEANSIDPATGAVLQREAHDKHAPWPMSNG